MLELDQSVAFLRYFAGWAGKSPVKRWMSRCHRWPGNIPPLPAASRWGGGWHRAVELLHHDCHLEAGGGPVCGCTIVLKPSEYTPLTLLRVAELAKAVGIPDGVINVVNGAGGGLPSG